MWPLLLPSVLEYKRNSITQPICYYYYFLLFTTHKKVSGEKKVYINYYYFFKNGKCLLIEIIQFLFKRLKHSQYLELIRVGPNYVELLSMQCAFRGSNVMWSAVYQLTGSVMDMWTVRTRLMSSIVMNVLEVCHSLYINLLLDVFTQYV